jgi:hypothetical protein
MPVMEPATSELNLTPTSTGPAAPKAPGTALDGQMLDVVEEPARRVSVTPAELPFNEAVS